MLKAIHSLFALSAGVLMLSGCAADVGTEAGVAVAEQGLDACNGNTAQKWKHMANFAIATAQEMGELNTTEQFTLATAADGGQVVTLSTYGASVCAAKGGCPMVQGFLDLQLMPNDMYVPQVLFNTVDYRNTMVDGYKRQVMQIDSLILNNAWTQLPEDHRLSLNGVDGTATCGSPWFSFTALRDFHMQFSSNGPIADMNCTLINEPSDPNGWDNNYLCSERNIGLKWSYKGAIAGMNCVNVNEASDPYYWGDNYLCTPENWGLAWSMNGPISGKKCILVNEPSDPNAWSNNYLCWDNNVPLNHPSTLCQEFLLFGGNISCNGSNPYIDFSVASNTKVKIDPTDYTSGTISTGSTGSCTTTLPYITTDTSVAGSCCLVTSTNVYGALTKYPLKANTYYCKTS